MKNPSPKKNVMSPWILSGLCPSRMTAVIGSVFTLLLAACGDDSSNNAEEKIEVVSSIDKLDDCTDKLEGDTVFVKSEKADYICKRGKWVNADSSAAQSAKDSSYKQDSSAYIQPPVVAIKNKSITGFSQKGPFVTGTAVKVYELDGKTYAQTGKSFTGKITSDDGKFKVSNVSLASQYALLEANGYFRNEITGEKSKGAITLYAITDLSDRKNVNINLLTHLEYERVLYLVGTGINVPAAKKQAEAEILKAFGISGNFASSEDLDIFSKGEGNAALLAISVMMLGGLGDGSEKSSEAELTERLAKFAADIEKDGTWDDEETKAAIADWVREELAPVRGGISMCGGLSYDIFHFYDIRENIEEWELGDVLDFEKYARTFWYNNYGLGDCNKNNEGKIQSVANRDSESYDYRQFICEDGFWRVATDLERDFFKFGKEKKGSDGELWVGPATEIVYKYDVESGKWGDADELDKRFLEEGYDFGGCTHKREGEVVTVEETKCSGSNSYCDEYGCYENCPKGPVNYVCENYDRNGMYGSCGIYVWEEQEMDIPTAINFLSGNKGTDGQLWTSQIWTNYGNSTGKTYIYDEGLDKWLVANSSGYYEDSIGVCTSKRRGETKATTNDYGDDWALICKETGVPDYGQYSEYYSPFSWTYADENEVLYGICDPSNEGQLSDDLAYICSDGRWKKPTENEMLRAIKEKHWGPCNSSNDGQLSSDGTQKCQDGLWHFYAGLIDDFEDNNNVAENAYPGIWFLGKSDNVSFSNSLDESRWSYDVVRTAGENSYAAMENISGITHSDSHGSESYAIIGLTFLYKTYGMLGILSNCSSIQYDYKGSGHTVDFTFGGGNNYGWGPYVNSSTEWKTITLSSEDIGTYGGSSIDWNQVTDLSWSVNSILSQENIGTYLYIDNVKCIR
ncbi:MAG: hypothetical protein IKS02_05310 [Fibrobacter sp.]|nr:hypothetical protein [Fibrobacter sp.]